MGNVEGYILLRKSKKVLKIGDFIDKDDQVMAESFKTFMNE